ncbi:abnormal spindle-like microcephaly-associated protein isoform X2 [Archocentrus centrarchus]|uniref:abnormal spindle-like microcephaly-associated protein isoform X2 n=1 Tax=Archocentrus centrarchus TaxID=63155 RepID=UPI0011EA160D|nr:abnormal spindle-like microcephaly-associated protein isoform X2 [Archocentrus centrarchus]
MAQAIHSGQRGFLDFSPTRRDDADKENDVPVLSLIQFSKAPFVTFGSVKLGTSRSAVLRIENPTEYAAAEVAVDKIPSNKGFSVDCSTFTIQPGGSFSLVVTWTPTEEGGIRELIIFNANGVLKHQAILLGRAEAPKKKKKSLWDTIKNKREGEKVGRKVTQPPLKMAANKTFQVSRKPQYQRDKPRSPLASLNEGKGAREKSLTKHSPIEDCCLKSEEQKTLNLSQEQQSLVLPEKENIHQIHRSSPLVLLVPAAKVIDSGNMSASPDVLAGKPENKDFTKILNRTLSPIGTPDRFKKLMPWIHSENPLPATVNSVAAAADTELPRSPIPSLKDALTLIDSDLIHINTSPRDNNSSCDFSDSLESNSEKTGCGPDKDVVKGLADCPELSESSEPRLTFFVSKKVHQVSEAGFSEADEVTVRIKKGSFVTTTVIKNKAPVEANSLSGRKIKKSRRRLLEKTLELSDGSSPCESGPGTPSLPVIDSDTGVSPCDDRPPIPEFISSSLTLRLAASPAPITFPISSSLPVAPSHCSFSITSSPPSVSALTAFTVTSPTPVGSSSPHHCGLLSNSKVYEQPATVLTPPHVQEESFPIHVVAKSKKRKSEEFLKIDGKIEDDRKAEQVKRSRVVTGKTEPSRSIQERRGGSQRQRASGSVRSMTASSLKTTRSAVPAQAKQPSSKAISRGAPSLKTPSMKTAKVVAVAQSKLTFIKPAQTALPRHPMPFAAKNMFYDERWIEKQERGFTWWINYVLTPDDFKVNTEVAKVNAVSLTMGSDDKFSVPKAPTKEEMSFSTYTARRKLNRLRRSACQLFTSETMVKAIQRLELEVEARRLLVRKDRHLWKDIGERRKVLNWLLSYNPLWLRIGLETIYGELISLESNSDTLGLAMFILQRLLWNPDIAAEFRHPRVPHLYRDGHEEALSRFTLKKLLLLVCFLDKAKESRLIEHDPCLFCVDAEFKASKDLLLAFSRDFLSGEGILPRHLSYLGLPVSHVQRPLDEFNFAVKNLAVDLRCGVRLVRVMELLAQDWSLSVKLRLPAISRLQKVHNVDIALQVLKSKGIDLKDEHGSTTDSRDIVDGHREKTLSLLWKIIFAFHVEVILNEDQLREEIGFLKRTLRTKRRLASLKADRGLRPTPVKTRVPYEHSSSKMTLLMDWVRAVCDFYNLQVENFTVTFSDGRVLCYLIHHYHPGLLPGASVSHRTTQTVECSPRGRLELSCSASDSDSSFDSLPTGPNGPASPSLEFKELLENEKNNFRLVNGAVAFLGGVPAMINPADMSNTIPSEKVVMSYLSFLCARLLDLRNETRAARVIQGAWRKYRLKKDLELYKERNMAAMKIQGLVRSFLQKCRAERQNQAAVVIQSLWRGYVAHKRLRLRKEAHLRAVQHEAATLIQAQWRMFSTMRAYQRLRYYTIVVQAQWRMRRAASAYGKIYWAATVIQKYSRAWVFSRRDRAHYLLLRTAVVTMQRGYRRWKAQKIQKETRAAEVIQAAFKKWCWKKMERSAAAVRIQSWYRMQMCLRQYRKIRGSAVLIQAQYRGHAQRRRFHVLKLQHHCAVVIQSAFRGHVVRKEVAEMSCAAVVIQRWFRASRTRDIERKKFVRMKCAAVTIQAAYRGKAARECLKKQHRAAAVIQATFRKYTAQRRYLRLKRATVKMQQKYRATVLTHKTRNEYNALRAAVLTVQANWRGRVDRKRIEKWHQCASLIQAYYRRHKVQAEYRSKKSAAVVIQNHYRAFLAGRKMRKAYLEKKAACVTLQAAFRGMRVRGELKKRHQAATVLQASARMFLCRKRYFLLQGAAVDIQRRYRALLLCRVQQNEFRKLKQATIKIQAVFRGFRVRQDLKKKHNAAKTIQAQFRMYRTRMAYLAIKCAAIIIQERYRAKRLREQQMQRYKCAAVVIQAAYRGHRARRKIAEMHRAATVIQRKLLAIRDRKQFLAVREAVLACQKRYRAVTLARKVHLDYLSKLRAVVCLQAAYRGYVVRKQLHIKHVAAIKIQSHFRMYQQRTSYKRLRWASIVLQARYRANKTMRAEVHALSVKKNAAVVLQAAFRGMKSRQMIRERHQAASVIQRAYRAHCERREYLTLKSSVLTLQRRYRASVAAKEQTQRYQKLRRAAVVLQAAYRGQQVRKEVIRWHRAATVIQSAFRKLREKAKFQAMRLSAIIIQRRYRAAVLQRRERGKFLKMRHSAVVLQAAFRGRRVRTAIAMMHRAATVFQANYRRHQQQSAFRRQRWAACVLQQRFRAQRTRNLEVKHYQEVRNAAIVLQAAFRGMKSRQMIRERHQAASVIQRAYRAHCERREYLTLKSSVLTLQRRYRASVAAKEQTQNYQKLRRAAVVLQAAYRGQQVRKEVIRWHWAATVIQSAFRKHREKAKFQAMRLSAIIIQRRYRAAVLQRRERGKFLKMRHSAVVLQAAFRGWRVRTDIAMMHRAATVFQANFRRHQQQSAFRRQRWAACVLQQRFRAQRTRNLEVKHYQEVKNAAIVLQAAFRGMKSRQMIRERHQAASVIQRAYRAHCECREYLTLKSSVLTLQRRYRASVAAKEQTQRYQKLRRAAVVLQAAYRGQQVRKEVIRWHWAATVIQSAFRKHREEAKFQAMRLSAIIIQRRYRAAVLQRRERGKFLKMRHSAVVLQAASRGWRVRTAIAMMHRAATVCQANFRRHQQQSAFRRQRWAACVLQQRFRAQRTRNFELKNYQEVRNAAIILQAAFRGMKSRQMIKDRHQAASVIQRAYRAHCECREYLTLKSSVLTLQRRYRASVAAKEQTQRYQKLRRAAVVLQAAYRGHRVRTAIAMMHRAATVFQANFRRHQQQSAFRRQRWAACVLQQRFRAQKTRNLEVKHYQEVKNAAIVLQAAFRGMKSRQMIRERHQAASVIQRAYRAHCECREYLTLKSSVLTLQRKYRASVAAKEQTQNYQKLRRAAVVLQAAYRGQQVRKEVIRWHQAATVIQSAFRKLREEAKFQAMRLSAIIIQRCYRAAVLQRREREEFLKMRHSAVVLQAAFRGWHTRRDISQQNHAAVVIQSCWRGLVERRLFQRKKDAAVKLQQRIRAVQVGRKERNKYSQVRRAAITLQKHWRAWIVRQQALEAARAERRLRFTSAVFHHLSAIKIQRALRAHWALESAKRQIHSVITIQRLVRAKQQRRRYLEDRLKVVTAQRAVRRWLALRHKAASVIQQAARKFLLLRRQKRVQRGIFKAQALWRGHRSRTLNDNPKVVKLRHRLRQITAGVREEDKLCNKTSSALDYLLRYKHFSYILEALKNLETTTRLSPECCERLVESGATNVIFTLIRCCNRSVPCMDVITFSIQILLNLSKFHKTIEAVYSVENSVETLLDLLQRYREKAGDKVAEKGGSIFTKACFLLALLLQDKHRTEEVKKLPKVLDRIHSIYRLTVRKHKMDTERTIIKQKMNASVNGSFFVPATPRKSRAAPKFAPDWVLRRDKLKDIVDPLRAIQMVANTLSIVL